MCLQYMPELPKVSLRAVFTSIILTFSSEEEDDSCTIVSVLYSVMHGRDIGVVLTAIIFKSQMSPKDLAASRLVSIIHYYIHGCSISFLESGPFSKEYLTS